MSRALLRLLRFAVVLTRKGKRKNLARDVLVSPVIGPNVLLLKQAQTRMVEPLSL
jgi:hypothetical protein